MQPDSAQLTRPQTPDVSPHLIAPDTYLIPNLYQAGPDTFLPVNSMVILGKEPIIVDTGAPIHTPSWFRQVFSLDGPTTRALYDESTSVLWAVDSFAALAPGAVFDVAGVPRDLYDETFAQLNSLVSPWHQWLDPVRYARHVDRVEGLRPRAVASAHGPMLRGPATTDAFARVRAMAGQPIVEPPGQPLLDELVAAVVAAAN
jgi:hypothetical protein